MNGPQIRPALDRSVGLLHATAMVAGTIVGASIFVQPTEISRLVPSIPGMLLVWLLSGILTLCGALVCAELASAFPRTGGVYVFLRESMSPALGFLWGWAMFWSVHSGIIAATAVIFARYVGYFAPLDDLGLRIVAIAGILVFSGVNYLGVRSGSVVQTVVTAAKILAIVLILLLVLVLRPAGAGPAAAASAAPPVAIREFVLAICAGLFAYGGWHLVTYSAEETRNPARTIPRALMIGTFTVTACYLGLNAAYLYVLPLERIIASRHVAADAASVLVGSGGAAAVSVLVIVSAVGVLNGVILSGPRVYLAMAQDRLAFGWMGAIHPRFRTPWAAILVQALWSSVLVATGTYRALFTRVIYTEWLFFALMTIGLFRLHRTAGYAPPYRAWGFPFVPLVFIISSLVVVFYQVTADPWECSKGLLLVAAGLPAYFLWVRRGAPSGADPDAHH